MNLNRARESLFENAIDLHGNVKFDDLTCFKSFNLDLSPVYNASYVPLFVLVEQEEDLRVNYVKCRLSFWIDVELVRREVMATNRSRLEYVLKANDYGLSDDDNGVETSRIEIELDLVQSGLGKDGRRVVELDADLIRRNEAIFEFEYGGVELVAVGKLVYSEIDDRIKMVDYR